VSSEAVQMSRGPHFSSNAKAENELGYVPTSSIDPAIMMRWKISSRAGSCHLLPADFPQRNRGCDFFESRITTKRMPKS